MGVLGACVCSVKYRGNCLCITAYQIFLIILGAVTLFMGTLPFTIWWVSEADIDWYCEKDYAFLENYFEVNETYGAEMLLEGKNYITDVDNSMLERDAVMCSVACPCDVNNFDEWTDLYGSAFNTDDLVANGTVENWADCSEIVAETNDSAFTDYFDGLLTVLEEEFDCQGICTPGRFYLFTNVDDGPVSGNCLK